MTDLIHLRDSVPIEVLDELLRIFFVDPTFALDAEDDLAEQPAQSCLGFDHLQVVLDTYGFLRTFDGAELYTKVNSKVGCRRAYWSKIVAYPAS